MPTHTHQKKNRVADTNADRTRKGTDVGCWQQEKDGAEELKEIYHCGNKGEHRLKNIQQYMHRGDSGNYQKIIALKKQARKQPVYFFCDLPDLKNS